MELESYFEFDDCDRIRVKGTRMAIEFLIDRFKEGESPETIARDYPHSVNLEQVYATITYYLHNKEIIEAYLQRKRAFEEAAYEEYLRQEPPEVVKRLLAIRAQREAALKTQ
jgi:uncharacterized protein (DUF433 family)